MCSEEVAHNDVALLKQFGEKPGFTSDCLIEHPKIYLIPQVSDIDSAALAILDNNTGRNVTTTWQKPRGIYNRDCPTTSCQNILMSYKINNII